MHFFPVRPAQLKAEYENVWIWIVRNKLNMIWGCSHNMTSFVSICPTPIPLWSFDQMNPLFEDWCFLIGLVFVEKFWVHIGTKSTALAILQRRVKRLVLIRTLSEGRISIMKWMIVWSLAINGEVDVVVYRAHEYWPIPHSCSLLKVPNWMKDIIVLISK